MTNKAAWAFVANEVRSYSVDGFPVLQGLWRLVRWAERAGVTKSGTRADAGVISGATASRNAQSAGESKRPSAAVSQEGRNATAVAPSLLATLRARARGARR